MGAWVGGWVGEWQTIDAVHAFSYLVECFPKRSLVRAGQGEELLITSCVDDIKYVIPGLS